MNDEYVNKLRLDQYRRKCEEISQLNYLLDQPLARAPQRLIGYPHFTDVFRGLIPLASYDDDGRFSYMDDFPEIFPEPFPARQRTSAAVLFTGGTGCGKHTADYTFMNVVYDFVKREVTESMIEEGSLSIVRPSDLDDATEFYQIEVPFYDTYSERQLSAELDELFDQMMTRAVSQPDVLFYFSLGDITRFLNSKRLMPRFIGKVSRLLADTRSRCILTAICEGEASELSPVAKRPFYVLKLDLPSEGSREEYFRFLTENYPNIRFGMSAHQLAQMTEGFAFSEVKQLAAYCMMSVKSELKRRRMTVSDARFSILSEDKLIILSRESIETYIKLIKEAQDKTKSNVYSDTAPAVVPKTRRESQDATPSQDHSISGEIMSLKNHNGQGAGDADQEKVKSLVEQIDTESDLRNSIDENLIIPASMKLKTAMSNRVFHTSVCDIYIPSMDLFLELCSKNGLADLGNLKAVTVSLGGQLQLRPFDKEKMRSASENNAFDYHVIIREGSVINSELRRIGKDMQWLQGGLLQNGCKNVTEVFLGAYAENGELIVFRKD